MGKRGEPKAPGENGLQLRMTAGWEPTALSSCNIFGAPALKDAASMADSTARPRPATPGAAGVLEPTWSVKRFTYLGEACLCGSIQLILLGASSAA